MVVEWEVARLAPAYSAAFFEGWMSGWDPASGAEHPRGQQNEVLCVTRSRQRYCRMRLVRPRGMQFMVLSRVIWTQVGMPVTQLLCR